MKIIKKNQIIIFIMALMLITAGYLNYTASEEKSTLQASSDMDTNEIAALGDAKLVNGNINVKEDASSISSEKDESTSRKEEAVEEDSNKLTSNQSDKTKQTSASVSKQESDDYFTNSRLNRDTMYSQMLESYQKILDNTSISAEQKAISQNEIKKINDLKNSIMICENLIKTKGFNDVVLFVNDKSINVIIKKDKLELTEEEAAQLQNIVAREMKAEIENIHISSK